MPTVAVEDTNLGGGLYLYRVYVDYVKYDEFYLRSGYPLTYAQMKDVEDGYRDALENYCLGGNNVY